MRSQPGGEKSGIRATLCGGREMQFERAPQVAANAPLAALKAMRQRHLGDSVAVNGRAAPEHYGSLAVDINAAALA
jgi:hypothetical protein